MPGTYIVSLTATNEAGSNTSAGTDRVTVVAPSATPLSPMVATGSMVLAIGLAARKFRQGR
jgi:PKD repeat protein